MKISRAKKKLPAGARAKKVHKPASWAEFFRVRDALIKADPAAFAGFMADRMDEAPETYTEEEDAATLTAIDEGIADAKAGRTFSGEEVRKIVTGRELAEALAKTSLSEDNAKAWRRDLRNARKRLETVKDKWR